MKRFFKLFICVGLVSLVLGSSVSVLFGGSAKAATAAHFIDKITIQYGDTVFKDINPFDGDNNWRSGPESCSSELTVQNFNSSNPKAKITFRKKRPIDDSCIVDSAKTPNGLVDMTGTGNKLINAYRIEEDLIYLPVGAHKAGCTTNDLGGNTIGHAAYIDTETHYFKRPPPDERLRRDGKRVDEDFYAYKDGKFRWGKYVYATFWDKRDGSLYSFDACGDLAHYDKKVGYLVYANSGRVTKAPEIYGNVSSAASKNGGGESVGGSNGGSCESLPGGLNWIFCPLIEILDSTANAIDKAVQAQLQTPDPLKVSGDSESNNCRSGNCLKDTWGRLRNVALIVLVPIMLVMVIGTAIGYSGLDAYTVKRAMPRLLIAVVFMSLSWYLTAFLVNLTNVVGAGVYGLLTNPFGLSTKSLADMVSAGSGTALSQFAIFGGLIAIGVGYISVGIIISLAATAAIALFLAFSVLVLRNVFIYALILLAPLAILAWIFPNNDKLWKLWWGSFSKLLLMYPMIMALIAAGKIFASIIPLQQGGGSGLFTNAAIIVAYISPYFFIPATFKFAGGAFANIAGMINDRGRGVFDRLKKGRQEQRAKNWQETLAGNRFRGGNPNNLRGRLNTRLQQGAIVGTGKAGVAFWRDGRVSTVAGASALEEIERNEKENRDYQTWAGNDDLNKFASASDDEASLRRIMTDSGKYVGREAQMEQDVARVERVRRSMSTDAFRQMTFLHAVAGGTTYDTDDSHNGVEWLEAAARAAGNDDAALANLVNKGKSAAMAAGRADQGAASFGTSFDAARTIRDSAGASPQERARVRAEAGEKVHANVLDSAGAGILAHSSMKPNTLKRLLPDMKRRLSDAYEVAERTNDWGGFDRELATFANLYDQMSGSSPQNAKLLADEVVRWAPDARNTPAMQQVTPGGQGPTQPGRVGPTIQDLLNERRGSDVFTSTRRELGTERMRGARDMTPEEVAEAARLGTGTGLDGPGGPNLTPPSY